MKNKELYKDFIAEFEGSICDDGAPWEEYICRGEACKGCVFRFLKWLEKDCEIITNAERDLLSIFNYEYDYIGRDIVGDLWLFECKPQVCDGIFESKGGRIYKCPDFIAGEFNGVERETFYMISEL